MAFRCARIKGCLPPSAALRQSHSLYLLRDDFLDIREDSGVPMIEDCSAPGGCFSGKIAWQAEIGPNVRDDHRERHHALAGRDL
jgi:hypothetical protein